MTLTLTLFVSAIVTGAIWWFTYLWIRRYCNPENDGDVSKYQMDAMWGGIASALAVILKEIIMN